MAGICSILANWEDQVSRYATLANQISRVNRQISFMRSLDYGSLKPTKLNEIIKS